MTLKLAIKALPEIFSNFNIFNGFVTACGGISGRSCRPILPFTAHEHQQRIPDHLNPTVV
jgi:hypothetical protein